MKQPTPVLLGGPPVFSPGGCGAAFIAPYGLPGATNATGSGTYFAITLTWTDPAFPSGSLSDVFIYQLVGSTWTLVTSVAASVQTLTVYSGVVSLFTSSTKFCIVGKQAGTGSLGAKALVTINPSVLSDLALAYSFFPGASDFSDAPPGTVPCNLGDAIYTVQASYGAGPYASQATSGNRPTQQSGGAQFNAVSDYLNLSSTVALTGDFTAYFWGYIAAIGEIWCPLANSSPGMFSGVYVFNDGNLYFVDDDTGPASTAFSTTGNVLIRIRRSSGSLHVAWTGQAEISIGTDSVTATLNAVGVSNGRHNGNINNLYAGNVVVAANLIPGGSDDTIIRNWIAAQGRYSL